MTDTVRSMNNPIKIATSYRGILAVILAGGILPSVSAATKNDNLTMTANVVATCSIQGSTLPFGNYQSQLLDRAGTVGVNCSNGTSYTVALDGGSSGSTSRAMQGPSNAQLSYELYKDSGHTQTWGNSGAGDLVSNTGNGTTQNLSVYGRIPAGQNPNAGVYGDVVGITLSY